MGKRKEGHSSDILDFKRDILPLTGNLCIPLTHDYMFTAVFRHTLYALRGFLAAKLNLAPEEITDLEILDPMEPGSGADDKDIVLDMVLLKYLDNADDKDDPNGLYRWARLRTMLIWNL